LADDPKLGDESEQATRTKFSPDHLKFRLNNIENEKGHVPSSLEFVKSIDFLKMYQFQAFK